MAIPWKWATKATVQRVISFAPNPDAINHWLQKVTGRTDLEGSQISNRLDLAARHLRELQWAGVVPEGEGFKADATVLELGTGWHPTIPILMFALGADRIISVDHVDHSNDELLAEALHKLSAAIDSGEVQQALPATVRERLSTIQEAARSVDTKPGVETLAALGIERRIADIRDVDDVDVDAVVSNLVLEHIPEEILGGVLAACYRLCRRGGAMSHIIDMCDHGHYVDPNLSQFNFLRFSERAWKVVGNDIQHENRLRKSQLLKIFSNADVPADRLDESLGSWNDLARIPIAEPFASMPPEDLQVIMLHVVSKA